MVPLYLPRRKFTEINGTIVLAADIGGTKTNLGLFRCENENMEVIKESTYSSKEYTSFLQIVQAFLKETGSEAPDRICIGVAGPVINYKVETTNLPWNLHGNALMNELQVKELALINDLEATAYGLSAVKEKDVKLLYPGKRKQEGNIAIIAPGTGLGEAALFWDGKFHHPFATEGGHCFFAPKTELDVELYFYLQKTHGPVSWEHVVSGPAIFAVYEFLKNIKKMPETPEIAAQLKEGEDPSEVISKNGIEENCPLCKKTMEIFSRNLAREATNLVLKMKATGGIFLGGGIPPKIIKLLEKPEFYQNFLETDRMEDLIETVPVSIILNSKTALKGAAYYSGFGPAQLSVSN